MADETPPALTLDLIRSVSPVLACYTEQAVVGDLWTRPDLSARDRSLVTVAALIARSQTIEMPGQIAAALDNGVSPAELSEVIAHLAFYAGWANAMSAVVVTGAIFDRCGVGADELPLPTGELLQLDEAGEARRSAAVAQSIGSSIPGLAEFTTCLLFQDLWLRPALAPRDRSLITVAALIAAGQAAQMPFHLTKAMDNGLTEEQAAGVITQLAFYAGWPNAMSAAAIAKDVFDKRAP